IDGNELSLQMRRQFRDHEPVPRGHACDVIAIGLRRGGLVEVDQARIGGRELNALVAEPCGPAADGIEAVERRRISDELREEDCGPPHGGRSLGRWHSILSASRAAATGARSAVPGACCPCPRKLYSLGEQIRSERYDEG